MDNLFFITSLRYSYIYQKSTYFLIINYNKFRKILFLFPLPTSPQKSPTLKQPLKPLKLYKNLIL